MRGVPTYDVRTARAALLISTPFPVWDVEVEGAHMLMMGGGMMLSVVISPVVGAFTPVDEELTLIRAVSDPVEPHVHCLGSFLFNGIVDDAVGASVIGLDWGGALGVAELD